MARVMLKDVNEGSQNWVVDTRVIRFCDCMSKQDATKRVRIELVLLDAEGNLMEGHVPEFWHKHSKLKLEEDKIYTIKYFQVIKAKRSFRATDRECMIEFSPHTTIEEPSSIPNNFPLYGYSALTFDVLRTRINNDILTSDTVCILTGCSHSRDQHTQTSGLRRLRNLTVSNGIESIGVALWGNHADAFDAEKCMENSRQKPIVLLLCGMTCRKFNDKLSLQNSTITRWYFNPDIPEAHALRQSHADRIPPLTWLNTPAPAQEAESSTVSELASLRNPHLLEKKRFFLTVKIKVIEPGQAWWYLACNKCSKKMQEGSDTIRCSDYDCPCTEGTPRYRLPLRVVDPDVMLEDNSAPTIQIVFFGPTAEEMLGVSVHDLLNAGGGLGTFLPKQIEELYGKIVKVRAGVGRFSFRKFDMCLQVNNIITIFPKSTGVLTELSAQPTAANTAGPPAEKSDLVQNKQHEVTETADPSLPHKEDTQKEKVPQNELQIQNRQDGGPEAADSSLTYNEDTQKEQVPQNKIQELKPPETSSVDLESEATPPVGIKRQRSSKDVGEPVKYKRGESAARRKLMLEESSNDE